MSTKLEPMPENVGIDVSPIVKHTFIDFPVPFENDAQKRQLRCSSEPPTLLPRGPRRERSVSMESVKSKGESSSDLSTPRRRPGIQMNNPSGQSTPHQSPRNSFIATPSESESEACSPEQSRQRQSLWKRASARLMLASGAKAVARTLKGEKSSSGNSRSLVPPPPCEADLTVRPGDYLESIAPVTMRELEGFESKTVTELHIGAQLYVLALGTIPRRVQVSTGPYMGWISIKTKIGEPLVAVKSKARESEFEVGGVHEVISPMCMRAGEDLSSQILCELPEGSFIEILAMGSENHRRARVQTPQGVGWISVVTKNGIKLVGKQEYNARSKACDGSFENCEPTTITDAARSGNLDLLESLCEKVPRPNINACDSTGMTALMFAIDYGHEAIIDYLLAHPECNVNCADQTQKLALHHAAGVSPVSFMTPSMHTAVIQALLNARAFTDAQDSMGRTPLMLAAAGGCEPSVEELLNARADIAKMDCCGATAVEYARMFDHHKVLALLEPCLAAHMHSTCPPTNGTAPEHTHNRLAPECTPSPCQFTYGPPETHHPAQYSPPETHHPTQPLLLSTRPSAEVPAPPAKPPVAKAPSARAKVKGQKKHGPNTSFTQQTADVMAKVEIALLATAGHESVQVRLQKEGGGYVVTVSIRGGSADLRDALLSKAQQALFNAAEQSTVVYVLGYQGKAFEPLPQGFQATLAEMRDEQKACWDYFGYGECLQGCACRWQHPAVTANISVLAKFAD